MADNIITRSIAKFQQNRDTAKAQKILSEIDTIVRTSINHNTKSSSLKGKVITGKLKKRLAPDRQILPSGIYTNKFNMSDVYATYTAEGLMKFSVDKYTEAVVKNGHFIKSKNPVVVKYLNKRVKEFQIVSKTPTNEFIKDFVVSTLLYGNSLIVKHRQDNASGGRQYIRWDGKVLEPIASLFIEDMRKVIFGEGPGGKMRYLRLSHDVTSTNLNAINPALFELTRSDIYGQQASLYNYFYNMFYTKVSKIFSLTSRRKREYVVYDDENIDHIRYHHIPGEKIAMPPFWATLNDIDSLRRIEENIEMLVYQYGHPILHGAIGDDKKSGSEDEVEEVYKKLEDMESNGFIITDNRTLLTMIGAERAALRLDAYLLYFYRRVLTGLWLSEVAVGVGGTASRATANTLDKLSQEKVFEVQGMFSYAMQIIMVELLLEAGASMQWILKSENIPTWVFRSVDIEGKIKLENHVLTMWEANMLTEDEMRSEIGMDPVSDAERKKTYNKLVAIPLKEAGAAAKSMGQLGRSSRSVAQKSLTPANQHGKKTGPSQPQNG